MSTIAMTAAIIAAGATTSSLGGDMHISSTLDLLILKSMFACIFIGTLVGWWKRIDCEAIGSALLGACIGAGAWFCIWFIVFGIGVLFM